MCLVTTFPRSAHVSLSQSRRPTTCYRSLPLHETGIPPHSSPLPLPAGCTFPLESQDSDVCPSPAAIPGEGALRGEHLVLEGGEGVLGEGTPHVTRAAAGCGQEDL